MGLFDRFKKGLTQTRQKITRSFRSVLPFGRKIDDAVIDQLEETMLAELRDVAEKMEGRMRSLERILDAEAPDWRTRT